MMQRMRQEDHGFKASLGCTLKRKEKGRKRAAHIKA